MINELSLKNFRGFASLELKNLNWVNLVMGDNNSGKTSLLEAIFLASEPSRIGQLPGLLRIPQGNPDLRYYRWLLSDSAAGGSGSIECHDGIQKKELILATPRVAEAAKFTSLAGAWLYGGPYLRVWGEPRKLFSCGVVSDQYRDPNVLVLFVGKAQRSREGEENLQKLLARIDPRIKRIRVDPGENDGNQVIIDIGLSELIPVTQAGQGICRLMAILAALIGENPDVLLIDEVENGLHHSVHEQIWSGLAEAAETLQVQVFATTHSDECFRAAHAAFLKRKNYNLGVIQLFREKTGVQGRVLDKEHIEAAIAGNIDLR